MDARVTAAPSHTRFVLAGAALAAVALLATVVAVLSTALTAAPPVPVPAAAPDFVTVVVAGIPAQLTPTTAIPVGGSMTAHLSLERTNGSPATRDLRLTLLDAQGRPVEGATIHVIGQMRYMDHGAFDVVLAADGPGRYGARLRFAMAGEHELRFNVLRGGTTGSILLDLDLH
jgi:hypothetical protein